MDGPADLVIRAARLFDGERMLGPSAVAVRGGRIAAVAPGIEAPAASASILLPGDAVLAPGFIDLQVNGGGGVLLNDDPSPQAVRVIAAAHRAFGTTGLLPTLITDAPATLAMLAEGAIESLCIPGVLGFHIEGPFINPRRKGIHPAGHIRAIADADIRLLAEFGRAGRSLLTLAPEMVPAAQLRRLAESGLRLSIGHSDATALDVAAAVAVGASGVTHLFNAMSQIAPREPGVVGAALASAALHAGIICDGLHVDPLNLQIALRAKGRERLMLVSDAMPLVGAAEDRFLLHGRAITLRDGRLTDADGTLAGAHLTMFEAVMNAIRLMGASLEDALVMASRAPAAFLGLASELGCIRQGYRADLVAFTPRGVIGTWIGGVPPL
jgi:N-acetylglucosamine-6-phosphate deacetylase